MIKIVVIGLFLGLGVFLKFFTFDMIMITSEEVHNRHEATRIVLEPGYTFQSMGSYPVVMAHIFSTIIVVATIGMTFALWYHWSKDSDAEEVGRENP